MIFDMYDTSTDRRYQSYSGGVVVETFWMG
jgi:hypothetical protein